MAPTIGEPIGIGETGMMGVEEMVGVVSGKEANGHIHHVSIQGA